MVRMQATKRKDTRAYLELRVRKQREFGMSIQVEQTNRVHHQLFPLLVFLLGLLGLLGTGACRILFLVVVVVALGPYHGTARHQGGQPALLEVIEQTIQREIPMSKEK